VDDDDDWSDGSKGSFGVDRCHRSMKASMHASMIDESIDARIDER